MIREIIESFEALFFGVKDNIEKYIDPKIMKLRENHLKNGHPFEKSIELDTFRSENHPHSKDNKTMVYTITIRKCEECGLCFIDKGLSSREYKYNNDSKSIQRKFYKEQNFSWFN